MNKIYPVRTYFKSLQVSAVLLITIFVFNWNSFKLNSFKFVPETFTPPMIQPAFYNTSEHEEEYSENLYRVLLRDIIQNKKWHGRNMIPDQNSTLSTAETDYSFLNKVCIGPPMITVLK